MLAVESLGDADQVVRSSGCAAFGGVVPDTVLLDGGSDGPTLSPSGRFLLVGDVRVDNREELLRRLGHSPHQIISDARLFGLAWERFGDEALRVAVGAIVAAVWDNADRRLTLIRSVGAARPLLYSERGGTIAFSSLPQSLRVLHEVGTGLDQEAIADIIGGDAYDGGRTMFAGIKLLRVGTAAHFSEGRSTLVDLWPAPGARDLASSFADSAEGLRGAMESAVAARLRRREGLVASQLSAGRDSSAVTALAAVISAQRNESIIALTGAPAADLTDSEPGGRLVDESALAAQTAALYPNVRHLISRVPDDASLTDDLDEAHQWHFGPALNPASSGWWNATLDSASAAGASVLLTGVGGNNGVSAGGGTFLLDVIASQGLLAGARRAIELSRGSPATRRNLLRLGIGAYLPRRVYLALQNMRGADEPTSWTLFREPLRSQLRQAQAESASRWTPRLYGRELQLASLKSMEPAEPAFRRGRFVETRDPTTDIRVIKACLRIPPEHLLSRVNERPLYGAAFGDLLPKAVLNNRQRGYQGADWYRYFSRKAGAIAMARYGKTPAVEDFIDLAAVGELIERWPTKNFNHPAVLASYRFELGLAVSLASFLHIHFA